MAERLGMDVNAGEQLARKFQEEARKLGETVTTINGQLTSTWWEGQDARKFKSEWDTHRGNLNKLKQELEQAGQSVKRQADQQRTTSNA